MDVISGFGFSMGYLGGGLLFLPRWIGWDGTFAMAFPAIDAMVLYFTQSRGARGVWREAMSQIPGLVGLEEPAE